METLDTNTTNQEDNNITGNGNWQFTGGQWQSSDGSTLGDSIPYPTNSGGSSAPSSNNPSTSGSGEMTGGGNPFAGGDTGSGEMTGGGNPFAGGGNTSTSSEDGDYNYTRQADERSLTDTNNPFNQLLGVLGNDTAAGDGNSLAGGSAGSGGMPMGSGSGGVGDAASGSNPFAGGSNTSSTDGSAAAGGNLPDNLPFGDTPPSSEEGSNLPETGNGLPVPYNSDDWLSDLNNLGSDEESAPDATGNTGEGNGNWFYGSGNTANGNGNWYFSDGNTTSGNGNWDYGDDSTTDGNGNWGFGTGNTTNGNGNLNLGDKNDILGNANSPSGSDNQILGSGNTPSGSGSSLLGNNIEDSQITSGDDSINIGNEDWAFSTAGDLTSITQGSSTPSQAIGFDISNGVSSLLSSDDLIESATTNPGYNNPDYVFEGIA